MSSTRALLILDKARRNGWTSVEIERALGLGRGRITRLLRGGDAAPETVAALLSFDAMATRRPERAPGWRGPSR
jgi:hypothetical protein